MSSSLTTHPSPIRLRKVSLSSLTHLKEMSQVRNDQKKDFVEKVNELNMRRTQAFSGGADQIPINQTFEKQNQFYQSLNHRAIDSCSNPFFETIYGKSAQMGGT